jgi:hypothetical protein
VAAFVVVVGCLSFSCLLVFLRLTSVKPWSSVSVAEGAAAAVVGAAAPAFGSSAGLGAIAAVMRATVAGDGL